MARQQTTRAESDKLSRPVRSANVSPLIPSALHFAEAAANGNGDRVKAPQPGSVRIAPPAGVSLLNDYLFHGDPATFRMAIQPTSSFPELDALGYYNGSNYATQLYKLFEEMTEKDPSLYGILEQRRSAVLCLSRRLLPASTDPLDLQICAFVEAALDNIGGDNGGFDGALYDLTSAILTGHAISEVLWDNVSDLRIASKKSQSQDSEDSPVAELPPSGNWVVPVEIRHEYSANYVFNREGQLFQAPMVGRVDPTPVPDRKFLVARFQGSYARPYGMGLLHRLEWAYRFQKEAQRNWLVALSRYGSPNAIAKYPTTATPEERAIVDTILRRIATDTGVAIPEGYTLELLEAKGSTGDPFRSMMEYIDDCKARCVLGSTLTTSEGRRSGSLALGQVHAEVAAAKVEQDARLLMWVINRRLIRWIVDFNFGVSVPAPKWLLDTSDVSDAKNDLDIDERLIKLGFPLPMSYLAERYLRPIAADDEPRVRYLGAAPAEPVPGQIAGGVVEGATEAPEPPEPPEPDATAMAEDAKSWREIVLGLANGD